MGQTIITRKSGGGSGGSTIDEIVESYVVETGNTITAGTFVDYVNTYFRGDDLVFDTNVVVSVRATFLTETKVLVCYRDQTTTFGEATVLEISGTTVTKGTTLVFNSANTEEISVTTIDSTKALVVYKNNGNSSRGTAMVLSISGTTITTNTSFVYNSATTNSNSVTMVDSLKAIVTFSDGGNSNRGTARVLEISGTTISASGSNLVFNTSSSSVTSVAKLETNKALVGYRADGGSSGQATVLSVSGTTITAGTNFVYQATGNADNTSIEILSSSKGFVAYSNGSNDFFGTAIVLSISGTTITAGLSFVFNNGSTSRINAKLINLKDIVISFRDSSNSGFGTLVTLNINDTLITLTSRFFFSVGIVESDLIVLNNSKVLLAYRNSSVSNRGYANAITITKKIVNTTAEKVFGLAKTGGAAASTIEVYVNS
jgi:hypothetical protein